MATKRKPATARSQPKASKQTLAGSIIERFYSVAVGAAQAAVLLRPSAGSRENSGRWPPAVAGVPSVRGRGTLSRG